MYFSLPNQVRFSTLHKSFKIIDITAYMKHKLSFVSHFTPAEAVFESDL